MRRPRHTQVFEPVKHIVSETGVSPGAPGPSRGRHSEYKCCGLLELSDDGSHEPSCEKAALDEHRNRGRPSRRRQEQLGMVGASGLNRSEPRAGHETAKLHPSGGNAINTKSTKFRSCLMSYYFILVSIIVAVVVVVYERLRRKLSGCLSPLFIK